MNEAARDELRQLLQAFLNGGMSNKGYVLYPFIKDLSAENLERARRLFATKGKSQDNLAVAEGICRLYRQLGDNERNGDRGKNTTKTRKPLCKEFRLQDYGNDAGYIKPIEKLKAFAEKHLSRDCLGFYLHGSLASMDYVRGWSDADTLIVLRKEALVPENLLRLRDALYLSRKYLYRIDPLQHHGHMVITEYELEDYDEDVLPFDAFRYAKSLLPDKVKIVWVAKKREDKERLRQMTDYFREKNNNGVKGAYEQKLFLSVAMLFPSIYLQARGIFAYKKFSFELAKKFLKQYWQPIDEISKIRRNWKLPSAKLILPAMENLNPVLAYQLNAGWWNISGSLKRLNKADYKRLAGEMLHLSEKALEGL